MNRLKKILCICLCLALLSSFAVGCSSSSEEESSSSTVSNEYPVTVADIQLDAKPERVVVLSENLADVILALGYEVVLKGKSAECTQSELSVLPNTSLDDPESLKALDPDLVLVDEKTENIADLAVEGIPVMVIEPAVSRADFERLYLEVGSALQGASTGASFAKERAQSLFTDIDDITRSVSSTRIITACYLFDLDGNVATGDTLAGALLTCAGVANAFEGNQSGDVTSATLKIGNPNYIFCPAELKEEIMNSDEYSDLIAVRNGDVYEMDPSYMHRQGTTVVEAVEFIYNIVNEEIAETPSSPEEGGNAALEGVDVPIGSVKYGDISDDVMVLQERLDELGYMYVDPTGEFGDVTEQAIKDFQFLNNITASGIADEITLKVLFSDTAIPRTD